MTELRKTEPKKLTRHQRVVAIAQDVLAHLSKTKVVKGTYMCSTNDEVLDIPDEADLQPVADKLMRECEVCAIGAMFISHVRLFDEVKGNDIGGTSQCVDAKRHELAQVLEKEFTRGQLHDIEHAFEVWDMDGPAAHFGRDYPSAKKRLAAIMRNIIRNKGTFKPKDRTESEVK